MPGSSIFSSRGMTTPKIEFSEYRRHSLEHVPKKLFDFFDQDMLKLFDFERVPFDHVIPRDRDAL